MEYLPRVLAKQKPYFDDYVTEEEGKELTAAQQRDNSIKRIRHHEGFILTKHLPHLHWRVTCEDGSDTPAELSGVYVRDLDAINAITVYKGKLNETTSD